MLQTFKHYFKIEYILLFLVAFEFLGKTNYIILLLFIYLLLRYRFQSQIFINSYLFCILLFSISYSILGGNTISFSDPFAWIASYVIGVMLCYKNKLSYLSLLIIIGAGTALHGVLVYLNTYHVAEFGARTTIDLWGNERGGTSSTCSFLIYSGILYSLLIKKDLKVLIKIIIIGSIIFIPLNAILISSRSALLYPFIILGVSYFSTINRRNVWSKVLILLVLILFFIFIYYGNYWGIRSYFESTFLYERLEGKHDGGIVDNSRFHIWGDRFDMIMDNFWGGGITASGTNIYMHNIVLDTIAYGGFPTALVLVVFMLHNISNILYIYRRSMSLTEKSCIVGVSCAFYIVFMFEPIIQASSWFFCLYLFFAGCIDQQKRIIRQYNLH